MNSEKAQRIYKAVMLIIITALITTLVTAIVVTERITSSASISNIAVGDGTTGIETTLAYIRTILEHGYIGELDDEQMLETAIKGYVAGVGDEYTVYYTKEEMDAQYDTAMGKYVGIGIYMIVNYEEGTIEVVDVMEESPALEAGMQAGDMITTVNGEKLTADNITELSNAIKESKEYLEYKELKNKIFQNKELKEKIEEFEKIRYEVQILSVKSHEQDEEKVKKLQQMYQILIENKEVKEFFDKEVVFNVMLADVNKIIAEAVRDVLN